MKTMKRIHILLLMLLGMVLVPTLWSAPVAAQEDRSVVVERRDGDFT
ncbi:MAG: hypothetical protein AVDCRST_MAG93-8029, partial [uncultured Chloroflexia bacterium]